MRGATGASDDHLDSALLGRRGVLEEEIGRAMGGDDSCFMWNTKAGEKRGCVFHSVPIGAGAHDDADERMLIVAGLAVSSNGFLGFLPRHNCPSCQRKNAG